MTIRSFLVALALGVLPVTAARAVDIAITVAPPPIPVYAQPPCPVQGYLWTPGYYAYDYDLASYYWVNGLWVPPPRVGFLWTPGYWGYGGGIYAFHAGYWGPTVGFYGGINYGFGYGGYGYYGGRWAGSTFQYNTAVTRVNVTNVHNTYVNNNFQNRTTSRASFNGRGGVAATANRNELRAASAAHVQATAQQRAASKQAMVAHHVNDRPNAANRDQARVANVNRGPRRGDFRNAAITPRNARVSPDGNLDHRTARAVGQNRNPGRNRPAFVGNPGRGGQQRLARGFGRAPRPPGGEHVQHGGQRGGGHEGKRHS